MNRPFFRLALLAVVVLFLMPVLALGTLIVGSLVNPAGNARRILKTAQAMEAIPVKVTHLLRRLGVLRPVEVELQPGVRMEVDPYEYLGRTVLTTGTWGKVNDRVMASVLSDGSVFVDVGAHIGYYTLQASKLVGHSGTVIAVEPNPPTAAALRRNIALNGFTNIKMHEVACTDKPTRLRLFAAPGMYSMWSSLSARTASVEQGIEVTGIKLDSILNSERLQRLDLVKIDVEGAEMLVLRGMNDSLIAFHPKLILELKADALSNLGSSLEEVFAWLHERGYSRAENLEEDDSLWVPDPRNRKGASGDRVHE